MKLLTNLDLGQLQLLNALLHVVAGNPSTPVEGQIWYDSAAKTIKYHDGTNPVTLGAAGAGGDADTLDGNDSTFYLARANHTGTQAIATVTGLQAALDGKVDDTEKGAANGVATLGADSKVPSAQLPALSLTSVSSVADIAARDALTVEEGDLAVVADDGTGESATFIYDGSAWLALTINAAVDSVNGQTGAVVLDTGDVAEVADARYLSDAQEAKVDSLPAGPLGYAVTIGDGAATSVAVVHNLGTRDVLVQVVEAAAPYAEVIADVERTDANTVTVKFATAPALNELRVLVTKVA